MKKSTPGTTAIEDGTAMTERVVAAGEGGPHAPDAATGPAAAGGRGNRLLWIVAGAFALLLAAWAAFLVIAGRHPVAPVPIAAPGSGTR